MAKEIEYKVILTEIEMQTALESINKTAYLGQVSDTISSLRKKLDIGQQVPIGRRTRKPKAEALKD